jgi:hypothetical protein
MPIKELILLCNWICFKGFLKKSLPKKCGKTILGIFKKKPAKKVRQNYFGHF